MDISFSIITCTYNPNPLIFKRLIAAISSLELPVGSEIEWIVVDNNSNPAVEGSFDFSSVKIPVIHVLERSPGLTHARIAGAKSAKGDWLLFFDDDNEPIADYLTSAAKLIQVHPQVGAWGPGRLSVFYINQSETTFLKKVKWLFQERQYDRTFFDNNISEGSAYYPYGTGMIVKKDVLIEYVNRVNAGRYTMSDRKGKSLMSAGDTQILFTCLQMGYYAGSCHSLQLMHLIDASKAKPKYIVKLLYALNSSQLKAYLEVFPDSKLEMHRISNYDVLKVFYSALRLYKLNKSNYTREMYLSKRLGELNARVIAFEFKTPLLLKLYEKIIYS